MKLLLKISYLGTDFCGFQCQKNGTAVQNVLTEASKNLFGEDCNVTGCSRTDAGVHALGFCCTVAPKAERADWCKIPVGKIHRAYSAYLPDTVTVTAAASVPDDFHPRYSAKGKNYIYRIWDYPWDSPFEKERSMRLNYPVTGERLQNVMRAAKYFEGTHDFNSFMATGSKITDTVRTVTECTVYREKENGALVLSVSADGFLYNMVRIMVGTLTEVASGKRKPEDIPRIIEEKDRSAAGVTAPACGLYLQKVFYDEKINWECV